MKCPICGHSQSRVTDSRATHQNSQIRRRRECTACHHRFTTYERVQYRLPKVIKSDGRIEDYTQKKLRAGLDIALRKRPVSSEQIDAIVDSIEKKIIAMAVNKITSRQIGELAIEALKTIDMIAYIRFASVYYRFENIESFQSEFKRLK